MLQTVAARDQIESDKGLLRISQRALIWGMRLLFEVLASQGDRVSRRARRSVEDSGFKLLAGRQALHIILRY